MSNDLKSIKVEKLYQLQEDIENFILRNKKQFNSLVSLKKSIIELIKALFNKYTRFCFLIFLISSTSSLYSLKSLEHFYQKTEQTSIISALPAVLLSLFILSTFYSITYALTSIISAPLYYKYKSLIQTLKNKHKKTKLYEYLNPNCNSKPVTINEFSLYLYKEYNLLELKLKEEDLKTDIEKHESSRNIAIIPLSIFVVCFSLFTWEIITGKQTKVMIDNFPAYFQGISFIVFATTIFNFVFQLALLDSVKVKKKALSALRKAQILITEA